MSQDGTKVTSDPERFNDPVQEGTGFVAKDSLAADSLRDGGSFAGNDPNASYSSQAAYGATASNTDTSGATQLDPARDAPSRYDEDAARADLEGGAGYGTSAGGGTTSSYGDSGSGSGGYGEPTGSSDSNDTYNTTKSGADSYGADTNSSTAPSYVGADERAQELSGGPKGRNIQEGGFDDSAPNASFGTDIGGKNDPSRYAENEFEARNAQSAFDAGGSGPRQESVSNDNQYDVLQNEGS